MIEEITARQLHDRATRGGALTGAERARLEDWYEKQDAAENALLVPSTDAAVTLQGLRSELEAASAQLLAVTQSIQTLIEENNALRQQTVALSKQLA